MVRTVGSRFPEIGLPVDFGLVLAIVVEFAPHARGIVVAFGDVTRALEEPSDLGVAMRLGGADEAGAYVVQAYAVEGEEEQK